MDVSPPKYTCPCCGYITFGNQGAFDICPVCFWEDDESQLRFPTTGGANVPLVEAQKNYATIGASEEKRAKYFKEFDIKTCQRDSRWRPIDPKVDQIEIPEPGKDYGMTYPKDYAELYYWMKS